jgi:hypothetical protein
MSPAADGTRITQTCEFARLAEREAQPPLG